MKSKKLKPLKKDIKVAINFIDLSLKIDKLYILLMIMNSVVKALIGIFNIVIFKYIINELILLRFSDYLRNYVLTLIFVNFSLGLISKFMDYYCEKRGLEFMTSLEMYLGKHIMNMPYDYLENPKILDLKETALHTMYNQKAIPSMIDSIANIIASVISLITMISLIAMFDFYMVVIIVIISVFSALFFKQHLNQDIEMAKNTLPLNRSFMYYYKTTMDFKIAKDIRLFNILPLFSEKMRDHQDEFTRLYDPPWIKKGLYKTLIHMNFSVQILVGYIYAVQKVISGQINIGEFTMVTAAVSKLSDNIYQIITSYSSFIQSCRFLELFMEFINIPNMDEGVSKEVGYIDDNLSIEFKNVYFSYPEQNEYVLKDVSFKIEKGDKISIVGENGAGKSTIVKLICRLYTPEKGQVLLGGININDYPVDSYNKMLSVVFQDFKLFAFSVKDNVLFGDKLNNENEIIEVFKKVGLWDEIKKYDDGYDAPLFKLFDEDGIELSGGQSQKLALARAIYKKANIMIFDEPASALDPVAEAEFNNNINELTHGQITIYISHRLSSSRFCNKIIVLDGGKIIERGNHESLVDIPNGKYSKMWSLQSKYYA